MRTETVERQASPRYWIVFVVLAIFTALEVVAGTLTSLPLGVKVGILAFLAIVKVALVLLYFMHLKFDSNIFALPFALGVVLLIPLLLIVGLTMNQAQLNEMTQAAGVNTTGQVIDVQEVSFNIALSQDHAQAGQVTFHIINNAGDMLHEFIVIQTDAPASELPTDMSGRVNEDGVTIIAAAEDIPPSQSRNLNVNLGEGHYVVVCNLPGHYLQGMRADFTVTGTSDMPASTPESTPSSPTETPAP